MPRRHRYIIDRTSPGGTINAFRGEDRIRAGASFLGDIVKRSPERVAAGFQVICYTGARFASKDAPPERRRPDIFIAKICDPIIGF
jgi:hypothetical protein